MRKFFVSIFLLLSLGAAAQLRENIVRMETTTTKFREGYLNKQLIRVATDSMLFALTHRVDTSMSMKTVFDSGWYKIIGGSGGYIPRNLTINDVTHSLNADSWFRVGTVRTIGGDSTITVDMTGDSIAAIGVDTNFIPWRTTPKGQVYPSTTPGKVYIDNDEDHDSIQALIYGNFPAGTIRLNGYVYVKEAPTILSSATFLTRDVNDRLVEVSTDGLVTSTDTTWKHSGAGIYNNNTGKVEVRHQLQVDSVPRMTGYADSAAYTGADGVIRQKAVDGSKWKRSYRTISPKTTNDKLEVTCSDSIAIHGSSTTSTAIRGTTVTGTAGSFYSSAGTGITTYGAARGLYSETSVGIPIEVYRANTYNNDSREIMRLERGVSPGSGADGLGLYIIFKNENSSGTLTNTGYFENTLDTAAALSEASSFAWYLASGGSAPLKKMSLSGADGLWLNNITEQVTDPTYQVVDSAGHLMKYPFDKGRLWTESGVYLIPTDSLNRGVKIKSNPLIVSGYSGAPLETPDEFTGFIWDPNKMAIRAGNAAGGNWSNDSVGLVSVALGEDPKASGLASVAIGSSSASIGDYSTVIGSDASTAIGDYSVAIGNQALAEKYRSVAIGNYAIAEDSNSVCIGVSSDYDHNTLSGKNSFGVFGLDRMYISQGEQDSTTSFMYGNLGTKNLTLNGSQYIKGNDDLYSLRVNGLNSGSYAMYAFGTTAGGIKAASSSNNGITSISTNGYGGYFNSANSYSVFSEGPSWFDSLLYVKYLPMGTNSMKMIVWDTVTKQLKKYPIPASGTSYWAASGNDIYNSNTGKVGIGTTSPSEKLHVNGKVRVDTLPVQVTAPLYVLTDSAGIVKRYPAATVSDTCLWALSGADIYSKNSGNVGIGTSSPCDKFEVWDATEGNVASFHNTCMSFGNVVFVESNQESTGIRVYTDTGESIGIHAQANGTGDARAINAVVSSGSGIVSTATTSGTPYGGHTKSGVGINITSETGNQFQFGNNVTSPIDSIMVMTSAGNVGIGTTAPSYKLYVKQNASGSQFGIRSELTGSGCAIDASVAGNNSTGISSITAGGNSISISGIGDTGMGIWGQATTGTAGYFTSNTNGYSGIFMGGNVGIGTESPAAKLQVNGTIKATSVAITTTDTTSVGYPVGSIQMRITASDTSCWVLIRTTGSLAARWKKLTQ